jgi:MoxR-like ATPase
MNPMSNDPFPGPGGASAAVLPGAVPLGPGTYERSQNGTAAVATAPAAVGTHDVDGLEAAGDVVRRLSARMRAQVRGRDDVIELCLIALLADGHVLLEDYPGSGKTTLAKALGDAITEEAIEGELAIAQDIARRQSDDLPTFRRIQFTPDLLPSDVTGVQVFDGQSGRFSFRRGPIFAHVVLADEINRTSPKVQSAMLEAMAEKQVTVDNHTYALDDLFFVIATQNPLDLAGTYPLPLAQLDRFLFKIRMQDVSRDAELEVLATYRERRSGQAVAHLPRVSRREVLACRRIVDREVAVAEPVREALVDLARSLRTDERVMQGASTRALVLAMPALQARAMLHGRDYVNGEDVEQLAPRIFSHRIELAPGVDDAAPVILDCANQVLERLAVSTLRRPRR